MDSNRVDFRNIVFWWTSNLLPIQIRRAEMAEKALLKIIVVNGVLLLVFAAVWLCPETVETAILSFIYFLVWLGD